MGICKIIKIDEDLLIIQKKSIFPENIFLSNNKILIGDIENKAKEISLPIYNGGYFSN